MATKKETKECQEYLLKYKNKIMERYRNQGGNSGVSAYEIGSDYIKVKFCGNSKIYTYSYQRAGSTHVENMKRFAKSGNGLNAYINRNVKNLFD